VTVTASLVGSPSQRTASLTVQAPYTSYALGRGIGVRQL